MPKTTSFELPRSYLDRSDCERSKSLISAAKEQLDILERQDIFFKLKDLLETKMDGIAVRSFRYSIGSHYDDDGYSEHIALEATFVEADGRVATMQADDEYGGCDDERFEPLHDMIDAWPSSLSRNLENRWIKTENEADLGKSIMGAKGYALYEANQIEHAAQKSEISSAGVLRI